MAKKLLTYNNAKILKSREKGYLTAGLHLLPGRVCDRASKGCLAACLNTSGHGRYQRTQQARARKTKMFWENHDEFMAQLYKEIDAMLRKGERENLTPALRLNLTSDIPWECYGVPQRYPNVQFYDYTKYHDRHVPDNYHLTFSRSEEEKNWEHAESWLDNGGNVAIVFADELPETYRGFPVIDGDKDDLRFLDPSPCVVGLKAKGRGKRDKTGFVVLP